MPTPTPTDEDVNFVREATGEVSRSLIAGLIDNLNDSEWERALDLVEAWNGIQAGDLLTLEGGREGVRLSDQEGLNDVRKRIRLLLGLPEFRDGSITGQFGSVSVPVSVW